MKKRTLLKTVLAAAILGAGIFSAQAADFPKKPVTLMVAYKAGGSFDTLARQLAAAIEKQKGWKVVIKNTPGAAGGVMAAKLKRSRPDGYTVGLASVGAFYLNPVVNKKSAYQPQDFTYAYAPAAIEMGVVAQAEKGWKNLDDVAEYAKANGGVSMGMFANELKLPMMEIAKAKGIDIRFVPTKGGAGAMAQLLGGHVDLAPIGGSARIKQVNSGKVNEVGMYLNERSKNAPDTPTLPEQGAGEVFEIYLQFAMPPKTPDEFVEAWSSALKDAMLADETKALTERMQLLTDKPMDAKTSTDFINRAFEASKQILNK